MSRRNPNADDALSDIEDLAPELDTEIDEVKEAITDFVKKMHEELQEFSKDIGARIRRLKKLSDDIDRLSSG